MSLSGDECGTVTFTGVISAIVTGQEYIFQASMALNEYDVPTFYLGNAVITPGATFIGGSTDVSKTLSFQLAFDATHYTQAAAFFAIRPVT